MSRSLGEVGGASPLNVILVCLVGLVGCLDVVSLAHHSDITLYIALQPGRDVIGVRQDGPLVMELVFCSGEEGHGTCHPHPKPGMGHAC